jgi:hypothetical protein
LTVAADYQSNRHIVINSGRHAISENVGDPQDLDSRDERHGRDWPILAVSLHKVGLALRADKARIEYWK